MTDNPLRKLPAIHHILDLEMIKALEPVHAHAVILDAVRREIDSLRAQLKQEHQATGDSIAIEAIADRVIARVRQQALPQIRTVINATGIILHTNLGRSPLNEKAAQAAFDAARGYLNLEIDLATGRRSSRQNPIRDILSSLTGAESATAVNNCAAATVIVLRALSAGKEVIVSRGHLIEIGGSFRIPEIMAVSGAILREVGTTNITRISDYEKAIQSNTGLLMRIHPSNYRIHGFTETASLQELVKLGRKHQIPVIDDVGSGALIDFARFGLTGEPVVQQSIECGTDLVLFSGDKLLGGPQAGLIVGKEALIQKIETDPLMRAFRLDKMTLAALESTLQIYLNPELALQVIPILKMMGMARDSLRSRCEGIAEQIRNMPGAGTVEVKDDVAYVGGGSLPDQPFPTVVIGLQATGCGETELSDRLRIGNPAVVGRVQDGRVWLDLRTVFPEQEQLFLRAVRAALFS